MNLTVNGKSLPVTSPQDTPLLYVLRDELGIDSPQFGCGLAQCGACSVLVDGKEVRSCVTPASMAVGKEVRRRKIRPKKRFIRCSSPGSSNRSRFAASAKAA
jgi:aerobic-type carbon monoxide dehydrogenase small subunit (CoxS/CutS family)